jgi:hypothetical protein
MKVLSLVLLGCLACSLTCIAAASANGRFKIEYSPATTDETRRIEKLVRDSQDFEQLVEAFNQIFYLPRDVKLHFMEDDSGNAPFYQDGEIVMNYEFLAENRQMFAEYEEDLGDKKVASRKDKLADKVLDEKILKVGEFVFFHEMGHALIDLYGLPVVGKEEDAVDTLAAIVSTDVLDESESALAAAESYSIYAANRKEFEDADFYDEHSLNEQRFFSVICLVYGSDPEKFSGLLEESGIPEDRSDTCQDEHDQKYKAWQTLLKPHMKKTADGETVL